MMRATAVLLASSTIMLGQTAVDKLTVEVVVRESNYLEMKLYQNPPDEEPFKKFKGTVVAGGPRDKEVSGRVERARKAGRKALNVRHNIDKLIIRDLNKASAIVETEESGGFEWSDNASPPFVQNHRRHTYYLKKTPEGKWLIDDEVMHPE